MAERSYTPAERRRRARIVTGGIRKALADIEDHRGDAEVARIDAAAEERWRDERDEMARHLATAKREAAAAKAKERLAPREERQAARQASIAARREAERVQHKARRYGL